MGRNFGQHQGLVGDKGVAVRYISEQPSDLLGPRVLVNLRYAQQTLLNCITQCQTNPLPNDVLNFGEDYFLTDFARKQTALFSVIGVLDITYHGLCHTSLLKVGNQPDKTRTDVAGSVSIYAPENAMLTPGQVDRTKETTEAKRLSIRNYFERVGMQSGQLEGTGIIKLNELHFSNEGKSISGIVTLIHEATHKFAGTLDYRVFDAGNPPAQGFDNRHLALMNADSYAWFAFFVGGGMQL
jgi:hypothetical protein